MFFDCIYGRNWPWPESPRREIGDFWLSGPRAIWAPLFLCSKEAKMRYLTAAERKEHPLVVRVTAAQLAEIDAEAAAAGITRSLLLRRKILEKAPALAVAEVRNGQEVGITDGCRCEA